MTIILKIYSIHILSSAINNSDAHAIDVKYHKNCWAKYVTTVLRKPTSSSTTTELASMIAAKIEFITSTEFAIRNRKIINMAELHKAFDSISSQNNVQSQIPSRKSIKALIQKEIDCVEFNKPNRDNESERVS